MKRKLSFLTLLLLLVVSVGCSTPVQKGYRRIEIIAMSDGTNFLYLDPSDQAIALASNNMSLQSDTRFIYLYNGTSDNPFGEGNFVLPLGESKYFKNTSNSVYYVENEEAVQTACEDFLTQYQEWQKTNP